VTGHADAPGTALLTGAARFTGDLDVPGLAHLVFVRSPVAHARLVSIDATDATAQPGVLGVLTAADLPIVPVWEIAIVPEVLAQPALATDRVRYVGERVAAVVADSLAAAVDAAARVVVDYDPLPAHTDVDDADSSDVAPLFDGHPDNVCLRWESDAPGAVPDGVEVTVRLDHDIPRLCTAPMEGHVIVACPGEDGRLTVHVSTQVPRAARAQVARTLQLDPAAVRVVTPPVGGGFGGKAGGAVCEHMVVAAAARLLGRPVRYVEDRSENLLDMQGRGVRNSVALHATRDGRLLGITADIRCDAGAYPSVGAVEPGKTRMMVCGPYRLRIADVTARAVMTNLPPVGAYRGPGRSEAAVMLERTLDVLATELDVDPVELRRRNLIAADEFPYRTPTGVEYDSGDYRALLERAIAIARYDELRREQAARGDRSRALLGIGVSMVVDSTAWFARTEGAEVAVLADGTVEVRTGSAATGQRHDRMLRTIVRASLPVAEADIHVVEGDTDRWSESDGTMGSRTAQLAGTAVQRAAETVAERLRRLAAELLEADPADVVVHGELGFGVRGVPASVRSVRSLVAAHGASIEASCVHEQPGAAYPAAAHVSVVEVDVETGAVRPLRHVAVTDCGRVLDAASAHGQVVGATAQGIAQALYEQAVFAPDGTPRTASFADYGIPSPAELPPIEAHFLETPSPRNPLGAKGVGEIGMVAAPVAVQNAVVDALRGRGVRHLDMPCTPERVAAALGLADERNG
jgi:carbon-monoxide dehydrogenase large subunit